MKKIFIIAAFLLISEPIFAININVNNYTNFTGKHLVCLPEARECLIGNKNINNRKYPEKRLLIKDIAINDNRMTVVLYEDNENGKIKTIEINSPTSTISAEGIGLAEDLENAKKFFTNKTLFATSPLADTYNLSAKYMFGISAHENTPYKIVSVEWGRYAEMPYRLMIDENNYIQSDKPDQIPNYFTDLNPKEAYPERYEVKANYDKLEKSQYRYISNQLEVEAGDNIYFDVGQYIKGKTKSSPTISILYSSEGWLFIHKATLYIDGVKTVFDIGSRHSDVGSGRIYESFDFNVTKQQIKNITTAKSVALRLSGDRGYVDGDFGKQTLYNIKRFYNEEIK